MTRRDIFKNGYIKDNIDSQIAEKIRENRSRWLNYGLRKNKSSLSNKENRGSRSKGKKIEK